MSWTFGAREMGWGKRKEGIGTSRAGTHAVVVKERPQRGRKDRLSFYWREEMMMREECTAVHTRGSPHTIIWIFYFNFLFSFFFLMLFTASRAYSTE